MDLTQPLEGIRVLDLSRLLPGPYATWSLSALGAKVLKVEDPAMGDYARSIPPMIGGNSAFFHVLNRGKRSLVLDLKQEKGQELLLRLVAQSDVVIEQFRPGVMARMNLSYERMQEARTDVILLSLSGFGQSGPLASKAGHSLNFEALSGFLHLGQQADGSIPLPAVPIADMIGAQAAVSAVLAALLHRERTGEGQWIDLSIADAAGQMVAPLAASWTQAAACERPSPADDALNGGLAVYQVYRTSDGGHVAVAALEPKFLARFAGRVGHEEWLRVPPIPGPHNDALKESIAEVIASKTKAEWKSILADLDACVSVVLDPEEAACEPQFQERGQVGRAGPGVGDGAWIEPPLGRSEQGDSPGHGEHTDEVLFELGLGLGEVAELRRQGVIR